MKINKLVSESLFEFERGMDPKAAIGIGRKHQWDLLKQEKNYSISILDIIKSGFSLDEFEYIDPQFFKETIRDLITSIVWILEGNIDKSLEIKMDETIVKYFRKDKRKDDYFRVFHNQFFPLEVRRLGLDWIENHLPKTAKFIKENSYHFFEMGASTLMEDIQKFFNPYQYDPNKIYNSFLDWENGLKKFLNLYPKYEEKLKDELSEDKLIEFGAYFPECLEKVYKMEYILNSKNENDVYHLERIIEDRSKTRIKEKRKINLDFNYEEVKLWVMVLLRRALDEKIIEPEEIKKTMIKNLTTDEIRESFPEFIPEDKGRRKMNDRSQDVINKDYENAENLLKSFGKVKITTSDRQKKNGALRFTIMDALYYDSYFKQIKHGDIDYIISPSGYLRKNKPGFSRTAVIKYDPYSTYTELVQRGLQSVERDLIKMKKLENES